MGFVSGFFYFLVHPQQLRNIIQWKLWHNPVHERDEDSEPASLKMCFYFLDLTSRSFSAVIKELNPELLVPICLFYLTLRGLDTIEDDMTLSLDEKDPLLRQFYTFLDKPGWTFDGNGPNEKDRELLVKFHYVITEYQKIKPEYQKIIKDITKKMGNGMADYANDAEHNVNGVESIQDYELYCHYVAGLVGEGLTRLFVEGNLANTALLQRPELHESMGQFLQQTNIIRDVREDRDDKRRFWPKEVWSKYVEKWDDIFKPENREIALRCSSEMVLLALERAPDCLFYLAGIRDQSVFNFAAIPQAMAIATLELCFRNPTMFERNIKITKGDACKLMWDSSQNLKVLFEVFRRYARRIHKKNDPRDPNFLRISIACGKIEQFIESVFPSQNPRVITGELPGDKFKSKEELGSSVEEREKKAREDSEAKWDVFFVGLAALTVLLLTSGIMLVIAWYFGARFDLALESLRGNLPKESIRQKVMHGEL